MNEDNYKQLFNQFSDTLSMVIGDNYIICNIINYIGRKLTIIFSIRDRSDVLRTRLKYEIVNLDKIDLEQSLTNVIKDILYRLFTGKTDNSSNSFSISQNIMVTIRELVVPKKKQSILKKLFNFI